MSSDSGTPGACSTCGGKTLLPIVYGHPGMDLREAEEQGERHHRDGTRAARWPLRRRRPRRKVKVRTSDRHAGR
jgi:hypothetical protein